MRISIRDDDVCYYSNCDEFEAVYRGLNIPISVSLIPSAVPYHGETKPYGDIFLNEEKDFRENNQLVSFLRENIKEGRIEILLHGYSHEYKFTDCLVPELMWKSKDRLQKELPLGKRMIEETFGINVKVFVAPSNEINKDGIEIIEKMGLNFSGCFHGFTRKFDHYFVKNAFKRYFSRILYGVPLGGIMRFKKHNELATVGIQNYQKLIKYYEVCKKKDWDLCLVTHYWQLRDNPEMLNNFYKIIEYVKKDNGEFAFVSECLD